MQWRSEERSRRSGSGGPFAAGLLVLAAALYAPHAFAAGPFDGLSGAWAGDGRIQLSDGATERIRCRATYEVLNDGGNLEQELRCASDSYAFEVESAIRYNPGAGIVSGTWKETTRNVGGFASGPASAGRLKAKIEGTGFAAELEMVTQGARQSVTIRAENADVTEVLIDLEKR